MPIMAYPRRTYGHSLHIVGLYTRAGRRRQTPRRSWSASTVSLVWLDRTVMPSEMTDADLTADDKSSTIPDSMACITLVTLLNGR